MQIETYSVQELITFLETEILQPFSESRMYTDYRSSFEGGKDTFDVLWDDMVDLIQAVPKLLDQAAEDRATLERVSAALQMLRGVVRKLDRSA